MKHNSSLFYLLVWFFLVTNTVAHAQAPEAGGDAGGETVKGRHQAGVFLARLLPNGVSDEDEILPLTGMRYSYPLSGGNFIDLSGVTGSGDGVKWMGAGLGISMHVPIETLIGHAGLGVDYTRYETSTDSAQNELGVHFVGGVMAHIGRTMLARFDMKLGSKPGTYLVFAVGVVFEFGAAGGDAAGGAN